jgi:hypothetical protein
MTSRRGFPELRELPIYANNQYRHIFDAKRY